MGNLGGYVASLLYPPYIVTINVGRVKRSVPVRRLELLFQRHKKGPVLFWQPHGNP